MYVKDNMTRNPYTVTAGKSISEVLDIMQTSKHKRIPVVDGKGKLIGTVSQRMISENTPNNSSSLSVFELNYLLNKLTVKDVMNDKPVSIGPDALLEEAATLLRRHDIACLPVVDDKKHVIGVITKNDIFGAFINLLGYNHSGTRYVINVTEDKPGILEGIAKVCKENNVSISNLAVYNTDRGIEVVVITYSVKDIRKKLKDAGYNVTSCIKYEN